jgi:glycosyltransferase involved in cell wall biosynthesis
VTRRIVHVTTWLHPDKFGGAERVVQGIARAQAALGHEVVVLTGNHDSKPDRETRDGVTIVRYPLPRAVRGFSFFLAVHEAVAAELPRHLAGTDVVHAHQPASAIAALGSFPPPRIWSFYAPWAEERRAEAARRSGLGGIVDDVYQSLVETLDRTLLERADRIVALSEFSRAQIARCTPTLAANVAIVPPGVESRFTPGDRDAARSRLGIVAPTRGPLLVTVRRLMKRMGLDDLLRGVALAAEFGVDASLALAGEGPERESLQRLAVTLGIASRVEFLGRVADERLPDVYRAADLFVLPTRALEGFGMATLEALACGVPVLATEVGATPEVLAAHGASLRPIRPGPHSIALGILEFSAHAQHHARAAVDAARHVAATATWEHSARALDAVYDSVAGIPR